MHRLFCAALLSTLLLFFCAAKSQPAQAKFQPSFQSLKQYQLPAWFRDAKFGIWSHWGPQAVPRQGDWYARKMYQEGGQVYKYHLAHYGHPSKFGYKDIIPLWKAEKWDPDKLMALYKKTGARYFVSMGTHHDNFFLWNSKLHRWNAANMGPKKDVVGTWQRAAKKQGLPFGVSEHLGASFTWYQPSHLSDSTGEFKGVPYDGNDPRFQDLYHGKAASDDKGWLTKNPVWQQEWLASIKELIDMYHPDLLYSDSQFPFDAVGREMVSYYYNEDAKLHNGMPGAVYTCKQASQGMWVHDLERGVMDSIAADPWQTDTSIGDWYYRTGQKYKSALEVIQMLIDIVSKNGNLLINVVQTPEGDLEPDMLEILDGIGKWMAVNGEGIYGSRPWKLYGEKPADAVEVKAGNFNENKVRYTNKDLRFTSKDGFLYVFLLAPADGEISVKSLGTQSTFAPKVKSIDLLGSKESVVWKQNVSALSISRPGGELTVMPICFRITFEK